MRRKILLLSAGTAVVAVVLFALGSGTPAAQADDSTMSWDVVMYECPDAGNPSCDRDPPQNSHCAYDDPSPDGNIEEDECPDVESNLWLETDGDNISEEEYFDLASTVWNVDGVQNSDAVDLDGDTDPDAGYVIPVNGLRATPGDLLNLGAAVGEITFSICGNVVAANVVFGNNIDDYAVNGDASVRGQPALCGEENPEVSAAFADNFEIWNSTLDTGNLVPIHDVDGDGNPDSQNDHFSPGQDCQAPLDTCDPDTECTPNFMPDGIDCTPDGLIPTLNATGYAPYYQGRAFGIAELQISVALSTYIDVNFMVFNLVDVPEVQGYLSVTVVQYPDLPSDDPTLDGYKATSQTVDTCPEYYSSPVHLYGVTDGVDYNGDTSTSEAPGGQISRQMMGTEGTFDYYIMKSTAEDWDGDTIANTYDRCKTDPQIDRDGDTVVTKTDDALADLDGDFLTGACDDFEDPDCPTDQTEGCDGNEQQGTSWNAKPPWDTGQDVDGDTYVNFADNCPNDADEDLTGDTVIDYQLDSDGDNVGDVCDPSPYIPGDGTGYAGSPGNYLDHDNWCSDQFSIGAAEPRGEAGPVPGKYCYVDEATNATTVPYVNPAMATLDIEYEDSNDDGDPDWADLDGDSVYDIGEPIDTDDNTDNPADDPTTDYESDACEAVLNTDPLDPSENNGSGSDVLMDCDGDGTSDADEEAAGTNPFPFTKVIVSLGFEAEDQTGHEGTVDDGALRWAQVNDIPSVCSDEPMLEDPPGLPGDPPPPSAIVVTDTENFTLITDDLDCSAGDVDIWKTVTLTTDENCEIGDFLDEPKPQEDDEAVQGPINEQEPKGWSTQPEPLEWDVHMVGEDPCILTLTVVKEPKAPGEGDPPAPEDNPQFDMQTEVQTIEVRLPGACVYDNDADCDACWDDSEDDLTPAATPDCPWDFYDVPVPTLGAGGHYNGDGAHANGLDDRDHAISIIADVLAVLEYSGTSDEGPANANGRDYDDDVNDDGADDGIAYDRFTAPGAGCPQRSSEPDGAISIIIDVLLVLDQSGDSC